MPIGGFLKKLFTREQPEEAENIDALRIEFKDRYHSFKLLLGANHKALEIMAEIEEALHASKPFGMTFVRAACTSVAVNVFSDGPQHREARAGEIRRALRAVRSDPEDRSTRS